MEVGKSVIMDSCSAQTSYYSIELPNANSSQYEIIFYTAVSIISFFVFFPRMAHMFSSIFLVHVALILSCTAYQTMSITDSFIDHTFKTYMVYIKIILLVWCSFNALKVVVRHD